MLSNASIVTKPNGLVSGFKIAIVSLTRPGITTHFGEIIL